MLPSASEGISMSLKGCSSSMDKKLFIREWRTEGEERRGKEGRESEGGGEGRRGREGRRV